MYSLFRNGALGLLAVLFVAGVPLESPGQSSDVEVGDEADAVAGMGGADQLARRVVERTGEPGAVDKLGFTFVVEVDGEEKVERRHVWWPKRGELLVRRGDGSVRFRQLHERDVTKLAESPQAHTEAWEDVAPGYSPGRATEAWSEFVNDSYWLLAPTKLFDPGVERALDDEGRLVLTFDGVGLTPGDRYALTVDRERRVVTRWHFDLQDGREGTYAWKGYETFGALHLSTRRVSLGKDDTVIRFEHVEVVPPGERGSTSSGRQEVPVHIGGRDAVWEALGRPVSEADAEAFIRKMEELRETDAFVEWVRARREDDYVSAEVRRAVLAEADRLFADAPGWDVPTLVLQFGALATVARSVAGEDESDDRGETVASDKAAGEKNEAGVSSSEAAVGASGEVAEAMYTNRGEAGRKFEELREEVVERIGELDDRASEFHDRALDLARAEARRHVAEVVHAKLAEASLQTWRRMERSKRERILELVRVPAEKRGDSVARTNPLDVRAFLATIATYEFAGLAGVEE